MTKKNENIRLDRISIITLIFSGILILFSFFAPAIFVQSWKYGIDFSHSGEIGDTLGGIMNPFIALSGVSLTFLAFYIQFKANQLQRYLFRQELDFSKFETQFYEMLRLHKENVNELEIGTIQFIFNDLDSEKIEDKVKGRRVFEMMVKEFEICYYAARHSFPEAESKDWINEAYGAFFHGLNNGIIEKHEYFKILSGIRENHKSQNYSNLSFIIKPILRIDVDFELNYQLFNGYSSQLAHYYRHLFQTVKFVITQNEDFISYEEKRKYLRILRAQLSNHEQVMLFYNWLSRFGKEWENGKNKFFTDYRMIHNIHQSLILPDILLEEIFDINGSYLKEKDRDIDPLFEYQDW